MICVCILIVLTLLLRVLLLGLSLSSDESTPLDSTTVSLTLQPVTTNELTLLTPSDMLTVTTPTLSTQSVFDNTLSTTTNTTLTTTVTTDYLSDIVSLPEVPKIRRNRRLPATDDQSNDFDKKETSIPQQKKPLSAPLDYQLSSTTPTSIENSFTSLPNIASPPTASYVNKPPISSLPNLVKSPIRSLPVVGGSSLQPNVSFLKSSSLKLNVMKYDFHQHNGVESKPLKVCNIYLAIYTITFNACIFNWFFSYHLGIANRHCYR